MKEQVRINELFQIKKFQPEYITWKSYALPCFDLKSRRELNTVFKIGVLTKDFTAYKANPKLYCSKFNMEQLAHMALPGNESLHMLQQDTAEKRHVSLLLLYSCELEHSNLIPKITTARVYCINNRMPYCCDTFCTLK